MSPLLPQFLCHAPHPGVLSLLPSWILASNKPTESWLRPMMPTANRLHARPEVQTHDYSFHGASGAAILAPLLVGRTICLMLDDQVCVVVSPC